MSRRNIGLGLLSFMTMFAMTAKAAPQINLGNLPAGKKVSISYDVTINTNATGNQVSSQALVTGANFADVSSDDPDTATLNDATISTVDEADTTLQLTASDATPTTSENVTFTATVDTTDGTLPTPTGNVEFRVDGGSATVVALNASGVATYDAVFGAGNYTVTADYIGGTDNKSSSNNIGISVSRANTTTDITAVSPASIYPGDTVTVSYSVSVEPVAGGIPVSGTVEVTDGVDSCTASASAGSCMLQFTTPGNKDLIATFTSGSTELNNSASAVYTVTAINNAPVLSAIGNQTIEATNALMFTANATDVDPAATITYSLGAGAPVGAAISPMTGDFSWTPSEAQGGAVYTVTIIAADQYNSTDSETISIDVTELDNPPVLNNDVVSTDEDTPVTFNPFDNDTEDNSFDFSTINIVSQPSSGTLNFSTANGEMTYTPNANFNGADQAQYQVKDDAGADSNIATINFTINSVNDLPVFDSTPITSVIEGEQYNYQVVTSDVEGDPLTLTAVSLPSWLQLVGNQLIGTPVTEDRGNHAVIISLTDGQDTVEQSFEVSVVSVHSNDLSIEKSLDIESPLLGEEFTLTYRITNSGPDLASGVVLDAEITGDAVVTSGDSRCQINVSALSCNIGPISTDEVQEVSVTMTSQALGDVYYYAKISSNDDFDTSNNELGFGLSVTNGLMTDKATTVGEAKAQLAVTGDVDNDGDDDIVLLRGANALASVFINQNSNSFEKASDVVGIESPVAAQLEYINDDNYIDLVVATSQNNQTLVFAGDGLGGFTLEQSLGLSDNTNVDIADLNNDGWMDIVFINNGAADEVYLNQGGLLQFSHLLGDVNTSLAIALADVDGNGLIDAIISKADGTSHYFSNSQLLGTSGLNSYSSIDTGLISDITTMDLDNDGMEEFVLGGSIDKENYEKVPSNKVYGWNGTLVERLNFGGVDTNQVIISDIDGDGDEDLFVANDSGYHQVYQNDSGNFTVASKLLFNKDYTSAAWVLGDHGVDNLLLAESIAEGSALYYNQGGGNFGQAFTDLALTYTASVSTVTIDGVIEAQLMATNNGPSSAQEVSLTASINSQVNVIRFGSGGEDCTVTDSALSCEVGTLMPGESVMIPLRLLAMNTGEAVIRAEVSSPIDGLNPSNDTQEVRINVIEKKDSGGGQVGLVLLLLLMLAGVRRRKYCK